MREVMTQSQRNLLAILSTGEELTTTCIRLNYNKHFNDSVTRESLIPRLNSLHVKKYITRDSSNQTYKWKITDEGMYVLSVRSLPTKPRTVSMKLNDKDWDKMEKLRKILFCEPVTTREFIMYIVDEMLGEFP